MTRFLLAAVVAALASVAQPQPPAGGPVRYALEAKDARRVTGVLTYTVTCPDLRAKEWLVFAAAAPELPGQTGAKTVLSPAGSPARDRSPLARGLLTARVPATTDDLQTTIPIRVTYEATLRSRTLVALPPGAAAPPVAPLPPAERTLYLAERGDIDFGTGAFQKWLAAERLVRGEGEGEVAFARKGFRAIRDLMAYAYAADLDRRASAVCAAGRSDCGGLSALFVAVMRANGIPARGLYGRWAESAGADARLSGVAYYQWHVKAEFFADGVGWVPVDPSGAVQHDRTPDARRFFGSDRGDFLTFHVDPNPSFEAGQFGVQTVGNLQTPAWWAGGRGSIAGARGAEGWTVGPAK